MAVRRYALRLDQSSLQTGDISLKELVENAAPTVFSLSNVAGGNHDLLELITSKNNTPVSHSAVVSVDSGAATTNLSLTLLAAILADADGGDWDYVEVCWSLSAFDTPAPSAFHMVQNSTVYDFAGWPPNK